MYFFYHAVKWKKKESKWFKDKSFNYEVEKENNSLKLKPTLERTKFDLRNKKKWMS